MLVARERRIDRIRHVSRFILNPRHGDGDLIRLYKVSLLFLGLYAWHGLGRLPHNTPSAARRPISGTGHSQNVHQLAHLPQCPIWDTS